VDGDSRFRLANQRAVYSRKRSRSIRTMRPRMHKIVFFSTQFGALPKKRIDDRDFYAGI